MNVQQFVELFPHVKGRRFDDLVADIKAHGLLHPIVRYTDGHGIAILDGRARLRACKLAGVEAKFIDFADAKFKGTPQDYLWSANINRRQLSADQRTVLVFEWEKLLKGEAKARQLAALNKGDKAGTKAASGSKTTRQALADKAGVTTHKVQQFQGVKTHAAHLVKKVASGKMKLKDAAKVADTKRRKVVPIRKPAYISVTKAVRNVMGNFNRGIMDHANKVADKKLFFEILGHELSTACEKLARAAAVIKTVAA